MWLYGEHRSNVHTYALELEVGWVKQEIDYRINFAEGYRGRQGKHPKRCVGRMHYTTAKYE